MNFDLRELEIFCAVVEQRSFTRAAEKVHLAQASVSERIAKLENSIGAELLHRSTRTVAPTAVGQRLYEGAKRLLAERQCVTNDLADLLGLRDGDLAIGASTIPGEYLLPTHLASFKTAHPEIRIRVQISGSECIATKVASGELEIGIISSGLDEANLQARTLWRDELVVAVPCDHRWSDRLAIKLTELRDEPIVLRELGSGTRRAIEKAISSKQVEGLGAYEIAAELGSMTAVKEAVLCGLGVSIISTRALRREIEAGVISICRLDDVDLSRSINLVCHRSRSISPAAVRFVEYLVAATRSESEFPNPKS